MAGSDRRLLEPGVKLAGVRLDRHFVEHGRLAGDGGEERGELGRVHRAAEWVKLLTKNQQMQMHKG